MASRGVSRDTYAGHLFKGRANRADMISIKQAFISVYESESRQ